MAAPRQAQLLESARHLDWLPDETLYSLASRHHRLSGNSRPEQTAQQLFGHRRGGSPHDLPAGLDYFAAVLGGRLGSGESVALERTILPGLLVFRPEADLRDAVQAMRSPRLGVLKSRMGLPASGFGASSLLKACVSCMRVDSVNHGTAYWRRAHQLPGASLCLEHQERLQVSSANRAKQSRFDWRLPQWSDLANIQSSTCGTQQAFMRRLTQMGVDAAARSLGSVRDGTQHASALWAGMKARGWITRSGQLNRKVAAAQWQGVLLQLRALPEGCDLRISESAAYSQLVSLLCDPTRGHVIRVLALATCLFDTWQEYLASVESTPLQNESEEPDPSSNEVNVVRSQLVALAGAGGSVTAAARTLGVAVASAQAWLAATGHPPPKRPSKLRNDTLLSVVNDLLQGMDPSQIAGGSGLSEASVRRVLRTTVGLRGKWLDARRASSCELARTKWLHALEQSAMAGPKAARGIETRAYAWLYRNDRAWLLEVNEKAKRPRTVNHSSVDWDIRDRALSQACQLAAPSLMEAAGDRRITLMEIIRAVPEVRTKLHRLDDLPLTARVIRSLVSGGSTADAVGLLAARDGNGRPGGIDKAASFSCADGRSAPYLTEDHACTDLDNSKNAR